MTWALIGAGCLLVAGLVWLALKAYERLGKAKAEKIAADHMKEAIENAAKMRRTAEDSIRAAGDGTAGSLLEPWTRD